MVTKERASAAGGGSPHPPLRNTPRSRGIGGILRAYQDAIIAVLLLGLAGASVYQVGELPQDHVERAPGMAIYPLTIALALGAASVLLLVKSLLKALKARPLQAAEDQQREVGEEMVTATPEGETEGSEGREATTGQVGASGLLLPLLGIAMLVAYAWALETVGYLIATPVLLLCLLFAYGVRSWIAFAGLTAGTTITIYLVFYYVLLIQLP